MAADERDIERRAHSILVHNHGGNASTDFPGMRYTFTATDTDQVRVDESEIGHGMDNMTFAPRRMARHDVSTFIRAVRHGRDGRQRVRVAA
jgi:hypothetical protein